MKLIWPPGIRGRLARIIDPRPRRQFEAAMLRAQTEIVALGNAGARYVRSMP